MRAAADRHCQLPTQVPRILNAGVHTLSADGTVNMRRVAGEEDSALSIPGRLAMVQAEARQPMGVPQSDGVVGDNACIATSWLPVICVGDAPGSIAITRHVVGWPRGKNIAMPRPAANA
jgi:hypothetical protein